MSKFKNCPSITRTGFNAVCGGLLLLAAVGCLQTRESLKEEEEKQVLQKQVQTLQTSHADTSTRFQEYDEDIRKLAGRVDINDQRVAQLSQKLEKNNQSDDAKAKETAEKMAVFHEAISKLENQVGILTQQVAALEAAKSAPVAEKSSKDKDGKGPLTAANEHFDKKKWQEAALEYEKYRKQSPKGKSLSLATFRIGVCFQEMGSAADAKSFYDEVIAKYPQSPEAKKAANKLKSLKLK